MGQAPIDLSDLPFDLKPGDRNYMIRFSAQVKELMFNLELKINELRQKRDEMIAEISQNKTSDEVFRFIHKHSSV